VWSGEQAKERGLVDKLGGLNDAIAAAASNANLQPGEHGIKYVEKELSPFEKFVVDATQNAMMKGLVSEMGFSASLLPDRVGRELKQGLSLLKRDHHPVRAVAFCFCEL
jgi:protease-4